MQQRDSTQPDGNQRSRRLSDKAFCKLLRKEVSATPRMDWSEPKPTPATFDFRGKDLGAEPNTGSQESWERWDESPDGKRSRKRSWSSSWEERRHGRTVSSKLEKQSKFARNSLACKFCLQRFKLDATKSTFDYLNGWTETIVDWSSRQQSAIRWFWSTARKAASKPVSATREQPIRLDHSKP